MLTRNLILGKWIFTPLLRITRPFFGVSRLSLILLILGHTPFQILLFFRILQRRFEEEALTTDSPAYHKQQTKYLSMGRRFVRAMCDMFLNVDRERKKKEANKRWETHFFIMGVDTGINCEGHVVRMLR